MAARTRVLVLRVNCGGQWLPLTVGVTEKLISELKSRDWTIRGRAWAALAKQAKVKLRLTYEGLDTAALFLGESEIEIVEVRFLRKSRRKGAKTFPTSVPKKRKPKKSRVHPGQLSLFDDN